MTRMNQNPEVLRLMAAAAQARQSHAMVRGGAAVGGGGGVGGCGWQPNVWDTSWGYTTDQSGWNNWGQNPWNQFGQNPYGQNFGVQTPAAQAAFAAQVASSQAASAAPAGSLVAIRGGAGAGMNIDPVTGQALSGLNNYPYGLSQIQPFAYGQGNPNLLCGLYGQARGVQCVELGFALPAGTLGPGLTVSFLINPSIPVQPIRIRFPSIFASQLQLNSVTVGTEQLLLGAGVPGQLGSEVSIQGIPLAKTTAVPGQGITVSITNISGVTLPTFPGAAIGSLTVEGMFC